MIPKKKILILTMTEGHFSIASAIQEIVAKKYDGTVELFKFKEFEIYLPMYQLFPSLFKVPYKLTQYKKIVQLTRASLHKRYKKKLFSIIASKSPDILISTYLGYDHICAEYGKEHGIPVYNVIANPRTIHPLEVSEETTANLVYDEQAKQTLLSYELPENKAVPMGWFVRSQFKPVSDRATLRKKLGISPDKLLFLVSGGSDGTGMIVKILPLLFQTARPLEIIIIAGNNSSLYKSLKLFEKTFTYTNKNSLAKLTILRFVKNIEEYIGVSDLFIGKAGPNSLFESVACHVPFFALTHISGQEDGNLEIITQENLGYVEENPLKAVALLKDIIENPDQLTKFEHDLIRQATYNAKAKDRLLDLLEATIS